MVSRSFAALAACLILTAGVAAPATAGVARTAACTFIPVEDDGPRGPEAKARYRTRFAVPAGAIAFGSPDGFGGRRHILGPANGTCVAHGGLDQDFNQQITLPGQRTPAFEQVFGAGGDYQLPYGCRYLPSIRTFAYPKPSRDCTTPPRTEHIEQLNTGMPTLHAALVRVAANTTDPQLRTTGPEPVLAVVLAFDLGGDDPGHRPVTTSYADCRLTAVCVASLRLFVDEAIAFQRDYVDFPVTGNPGARIRHALT